MVNKVLVSVIVVAILVGVGFFSFQYFSEKDNFSVTPILLKLSFPENGTSINKIIVENKEKFYQDFKISKSGLDGLVSLELEDFSLGPSEKKEMEVYFKDTGKGIGVYSGNLIVETSSLKKEIPLVLTIEDLNSVFAIVHTTLSKENGFSPGEEFGINIKLFDLSEIFLPTVKAEYSLQNSNGELILSDKINLIVGGVKTEIISLPEDLPLGSYVFVTTIDYKGTKSVGSYLFNVLEDDSPLFNSSNLFIILVVLVVLAFAFFAYFLKTRDDLLVKLRGQQNEELKYHLKLIEASRREFKKIKNLPERKKNVVALKKAKKKIIKIIKIKQRKQRIQVKKLKKQGKKDKIETSLRLWRKQGYKMFEAEKEMKKITNKDMVKQIKGFGGKGFKTGFLEK